MKRLLVVSATPSLAMGLAAGGYETVVMRPAEVLLEPLPKVDVVVLDQESADDALALLGRVRDRALTCPALLLLPGSELSRAAEAGLPAVLLQAKPVARDAFLATVGRTAQLGRGRHHDGQPEPSPAVHAARLPAQHPPRAAEPPAGTPTPQIDLREHVAEQPAEPTVGQLVRALIPRAHGLFSVPETAQVIIDDAIARVPASAGALLVPDHGVWRVAAGVNLRSLELRYELAADSWLVDTIATAHKGVIIEDSDVARRPLQGAPLAGYRNLLAAPVPSSDALLMLARSHDPGFTEADLAQLAKIGDEAGALLADAIQARTLARSLDHLCDIESRSPIVPGLAERPT